MHKPHCICDQFFYFGRCIPWIIIDRMPYFSKWKIQEAKVPTTKQQWDCTKYVLFTHFTVELPQVRTWKSAMAVDRRRPPC